MKLTPWYFAAIAPVVVAGLSNAFMGQMAVLAVVLSIFIGTVSLDRTPRAAVGGAAGVGKAGIKTGGAVSQTVARLAAPVSMTIASAAKSSIVPSREAA
jgi:hypothetical protein